MKNFLKKKNKWHKLQEIQMLKNQSLYFKH